eukprot:754897-Hanusia_phi.AAC.4
MSDWRTDPFRDAATQCCYFCWLTHKHACHCPRALVRSKLIPVPLIDKLLQSAVWSGEHKPVEQGLSVR